MSELHKFLFDGLPVRGALVRLTDDWREILRRRAQMDGGRSAFAVPVAEFVGELTAAGVLLQSTLRFDGALVLQIYGDGPLKLAVAEVQSDYAFRATAKIVGEVPALGGVERLVNAGGNGRCAITLDPRGRQPGQQPYQGVVPLSGDDGRPLAHLSEVIENYMARSEQLDTRIVLAANDELAAGLLVQRMPLEGEKNLGTADAQALAEHFHRIALLAASLKREELLTLDADTVLRRLFWEEPLRRIERAVPHFACSCSAERVANMLRGLGRAEVEDILAEQGQVEVGCDFCGAQYRFDAVDAARLFTPGGDQPPASQRVQ